MIHYITYSNELYSETRDFSGKMAYKKGKVDNVIIYKPEDIDKDFREKYVDILELKAGNGLWLWKPYFLFKTLEKVSDNDVVIYCDAGSFFFRSCKDIVESMDDDIWVSNIPLIEKQFTKPELFEQLGCIDIRYTDTNQIQANFIAIRKTNRGLRFAQEWLNACCEKENLIQDTRYTEESLGFDYFGHRYDQSILSLLAKKWNLKIHLDPSQYGRVPEKYYVPGRFYKKPDNCNEYKPCIILHRGRTIDFKTCINQWVCTWLPLWIVHKCSTPCRQVKSMKE